MPKKNVEVTCVDRGLGNPLSRTRCEEYLSEKFQLSRIISLLNQTIKKMAPIVCLSKALR